MRNMNGKSVWIGAAAAAAVLLAPKAHAIGWCPTPTNNQITCCHCSRELTCNVNGFGISIVGNGVTLDGKTFQIDNAPGSAITVTGFATTIRYVNIHNPGFNGIIMQAPSWDGSTPSSIDHVYISGAGSAGNGYNYDGIENRSVHPLSISNTSVYYSSGSGVESYGARNTDLLATISNHNYWAGYEGYQHGNNSWVRNSTFAYNSGGGVVFDEVSGVVVSGNTIMNNVFGGLFLQDVGGTVKNNYGRGNYMEDCTDQQRTTRTISASGNDWGSYSGSGCKP